MAAAERRAVIIVESLVHEPGCRPFDEVVDRMAEQLRRHGFVAERFFDLDRELLARTGAQLRPYRVLLVFNPAVTHRILRCDPAAADRAVVLVTVRDTGDGIVVGASDPAQPVPPHLAAAVRDLNELLRTALSAAG